MDSVERVDTVGACAGRILGILIQWAQYTYPASPAFTMCEGDLDCVIPGLYAMVGAAATLSGVTVSLSGRLSCSRSLTGR